MGLFDEIDKEIGVKNTLIPKLMEKPPKERTVPKILNFEKNSRHQADTLYLQTDGAYKYALSVIDTSTKLGDARPMKGHSAKDVIQALKSIYNGSILSKPKVLETDDGTEFKGVMLKFLEQNGIDKKTARVNRHRQVALAEYLNYVIGRGVARKQKTVEHKTGKISSQWVSILPGIIRGYNRYTKRTKEQNMEKKESKVGTVRCKGMECILLDKNTKVRVKADRPMNEVTGKKESGNFRAGDFRWDPTVRKITKVILKSGQPPMYRVSGIGNAIYTRPQLQIVGNEKGPKPDRNRTWIVDKIIKRVEDDGKVMYEVKWRNYEETTLEPRSSLMKGATKKVKNIIKKLDKEAK